MATSIKTDPFTALYKQAGALETENTKLQKTMSAAIDKNKPTAVLEAQNNIKKNLMNIEAISNMMKAIMDTMRAIINNMR